MFRISLFSQGRTLKKTAWDQVSKAYFVFPDTWVMAHELLYAKELYLSWHSYLSGRKNKAYSLLCLWLVLCLLPYYVLYTYINNNITFATAQGCNITKYFYTDRTVNGSIFFQEHLEEIILNIFFNFMNLFTDFGDQYLLPMSFFIG